MTVIVPARPASLEKFVVDTRAASTTAQGDIARLRASWDAFAAADKRVRPRRHRPATSPADGR